VRGLCYVVGEEDERREARGRQRKMNSVTVEKSINWGGRYYGQSSRGVGVKGHEETTGTVKDVEW